jgi:hypothetical protein
MRRWAAALGLGLILFSAGCAGGGADITDGWRMMPAASQFRPDVGKCHAELIDLGDAVDYRPVPCTSSHKAETVAVFDLTPAEALTADSRQAKAYSECSKRINAWLGNDWRTGWTTIAPVLPGELGWTGGARWVRCDVAQISPDEREVIARKGSMKGALKPGGKLQMKCTNSELADGDIVNLRPASCTSWHNGEFAGLFQSKTRDQPTDAQLEKGCYPVLARFTGVPNDRDLSKRMGWLAFASDDEGWYRGDHSVRCFVWFGDWDVTGSYRKAGPGRLPAH